MEREIIISLNDFHIPFHDPSAIDVAFQLVKHIEPITIIVHEVLDWYSLSRFDKDPNRKMRLKEDLVEAIVVLQRLRKLCPETRIVMVESNHDKRLIKYLRTKAEELHNLGCLKIESLLHLKDLNIEYRKDYIFRNVLFKHGDVIRKYSGYTARAELDKEGVSGMSGHTHRLAMHYETLRGGKYVWMESGCLCDPKQAEYIDGTANWQNGCAMFIFQKGSKHFQPVLLPIIDNEILYGDKTFRSTV